MKIKSSKRKDKDITVKMNIRQEYKRLILDIQSNCMDTYLLGMYPGEILVPSSGQINNG